jgi:gamma-glutamylcyclotransferase (GGCT)/AIG2-like uncharacterized protein YtfP
MKHALFYGSLKQGEFNFDRFGQGSQKYIKTVTLDGYNLYDLSWYPGLTKGDGKVIVELHEVDDHAFENIKRMEAGAGYIEGKEKIDDVEASIFFYKGNLQGKPLIQNGNWTGKKI